MNVEIKCKNNYEKVCVYIYFRFLFLYLFLMLHYLNFSQSLLENGEFFKSQLEKGALDFTLVQNKKLGITV